MNRYKIELSKFARNDYLEIIKYIKYNLKEPNISYRYAKLIKEEIKKLEYNPQKFSIIDIDSIKSENIRKLIIKNYIVFYRINEDKKSVNVERILYGGTDWKNIL